MNQKMALLIHLLRDPKAQRVLVFTRTKRDANRVTESLMGAQIGAAAIHGNKSQSARERALDSIKDGTARVLVATDIAARGIDIDRVTHVINYDIPNIPETYVHRIGRTARAGHTGIAISLCAPEERAFLSDIERLILANVRTPLERRGDLNAQLACLRVGERRIIELAAKYGTDMLLHGLDALLDYAERRMRQCSGRVAAVWPAPWPGRRALASTPGCKPRCLACWGPTRISLCASLPLAAPRGFPSAMRRKRHAWRANWLPAPRWSA
jgi:superfamily II DNA/RNA helicase